MQVQRENNRWLLCGFIFLAVLASSERIARAETRPPNIVILLADDLGYSDLGCYGSEIATPNLDGLAANGVRWTQFYNTARCWPTRGALLTGYYAQQIRRDKLPTVAGGGQGKRPPWAILLPEALKPLGYRSYHSGKWHVDGKVLAGGFDRSYSLDDHNRFFFPAQHTRDDEKLEKVASDEKYYATTAIADHAIECLKEHASKHAEQPFFSYIAFTSPHFPLQAPAADIAKYADRYRVGWDVIRAERWKSIQKQLRLPGDLAPLEESIGPPYHFPDDLEALGPGEVNRERAWDSLTPEQREFQANKMAVHAAMVDRMDQEIGRVIEQLRSSNALENTMIFFLSDNGASAEIMVRGDGHDRTAAPGSAKTFLCLGPGWSRAANTPFRRHKTWVHEGGISTPCIVHWPKGKLEAGALRHQPAHVIDIAPTILAAAGGGWPKSIDGKNVPEHPGRSLLPALLGNDPIERQALWWLHEDNRAIRMGDWKLVAAKGEPWELYDLAHDRSETHDLATEQSERVRKMESEWQSLTDAFSELK